MSSMSSLGHSSLGQSSLGQSSMGASSMSMSMSGSEGVSQLLGSPEKSTQEAIFQYELRDLSEWSPMRHFGFGLLQTTAFQAFMLILIFINTVIVVLQLSRVSAITRYAGFALTVFDQVALGFYVFEIILMIYVHRSRFFKSFWCWYDFLITLCGVFECFALLFITRSSGLNATTVTGALRVARLFRQISKLRSIRALHALSFLANLQVLTSTIFRSIPALGGIFCLILCCLFVLGAICVELFGKYDNDFGTLLNSSFQLFIVSTLDNWFEYYDTLAIAKKVNEGVVAIALIIDIVLQNFILINFFTAVITNNLESSLHKLNQWAAERKLREKRATQRQELMLQGFIVSKNGTVREGNTAAGGTFFGDSWLSSIGQTASAGSMGFSTMAGSQGSFAGSMTGGSMNGDFSASAGSMAMSHGSQGSQVEVAEVIGIPGEPTLDMTAGPDPGKNDNERAHRVAQYAEAHGGRSVVTYYRSDFLSAREKRLVGLQLAIYAALDSQTEALNTQQQLLDDLIDHVLARKTIQTPNSHLMGDGGETADQYTLSYGNPSIHFEMIQDVVRTETYRRALQNCSSSFVKGRIVLDVGSGSGILSIFAARAGARHVVALEMSSIAQTAYVVIRDNGCENIITLINASVENTTSDDIYKALLPAMARDSGLEAAAFEEIDGQRRFRADIIVSEWQGYALLYESMFDSVILARDMFLRPGGHMIPSACSLHLGLYQDEEGYEHDMHQRRWQYGIDLRALVDLDFTRADVDRFSPDALITSSDPNDTCIARWDMVTANSEDFSLTRQHTLSLTCNRGGPIHGVLLWFDLDMVPSQAEYQGEERVLPLYESACEDCPYEQPPVDTGHLVLSTSPMCPYTHWQQTFFPLYHPIVAKRGDVIQIRDFTTMRNTTYNRAWIFEFSLVRSDKEIIQVRRPLD